MKAALMHLFLLSLAAAKSADSADAPATSPSKKTDWIREGTYVKLYSAYLDDFVKQHPKTLVVVYDTSAFSQSVLQEIETVHEKLAQKGVKLNLAKMFHGDAERHLIQWNIHHFPHLRLFVGEEVYIDLNMYPSSDNVYNELTRILAANDTISEIESHSAKERFGNEPVAFYLRFPKGKSDFVYFLEKIQQLDDNIRVYFTTHPDLDPFNSHKPSDVVVGFKRNFDDKIKFIASEDKLDRNNILSFYHAFRQPDVQWLDEELLYSILSKKIRAVVFFQDDDKQERLQQFRRLAFIHKNEFLFVLAKPQSPAGRELRQFSHIDNGAGDVIRVLSFRENDVLTYHVGINSFEEMNEAIGLFNKGALEPISDGPFVDGEL